MGELFVLLCPIEEWQHQGGEEKGTLLPLLFLGLLHAVYFFRVCFLTCVSGSLSSITEMSSLTVLNVSPALAASQYRCGCISRLGEVLHAPCQSCREFCAAGNNVLLNSPS